MRRALCRETGGARRGYNQRDALDPEIAAYLEAQKSLPPRSALTLEQTRARMVEAAWLNGGPAPEVPSRQLLLRDGLQVREYRPTEERPDSPLVLYFHGGRFISGDLDSHDPLCRRLAMEARCRLVAVDYRLAPEHPFPAAIEDALWALDWALSQGDRIVVAGDSAGANLAAVLAAQRRREIRGQVLIYPMIDATRSLPSHAEFGEGFGPSTLDMKRGWDEYLSAGGDPTDWRISPLFTRNLEELPPAMVITAEFDCLRDEGEQYAHNMGLAGNRVELKRCQGAIHGFITLTGMSRLAREAVGSISGYLAR